MRPEGLEALARQLVEAARKVGPDHAGAQMGVLTLAAQWALKAHCTRIHHGFNRGSDLRKIFDDLNEGEQEACAQAVGGNVNHLRSGLAAVETELGLAAELFTAAQAKRTAAVLERLVQHLSRPVP